MSDIRAQLHEDVPLRGCVFGLIFAVPMWLLIGLISWLIFKS